MQIKVLNYCSLAPRLWLTLFAIYAQTHEQNPIEPLVIL
jgi:hypothetical protein